MSYPKVVLLVDDDIEVRRCTARILRRYGLDVHEASNGREGLECFQQRRRELSIVVSDIVMPEMDGLALAMSILSIDQKMPILLMSGYSVDLCVAEGRKSFPFINKPFFVEPFMRKINDLLGGGRFSGERGQTAERRPLPSSSSTRQTE
jgi:DNA-binding NtrC family response regulator